MSSPIITKVIEGMNDLPDDLQQQVLKFVVDLRQQHLQQSFLKSERGAGGLPLRGGAAPTPLFTTNL